MRQSISSRPFSQYEVEETMWQQLRGNTIREVTLLDNYFAMIGRATTSNDIHARAESKTSISF